MGTSVKQMVYIRSGKRTGRLTSFDRDEIRAAAAQGIGTGQLAEEYQRSRVTIRRIIRRSD